MKSLRLLLLCCLSVAFIIHAAQAQAQSKKTIPGVGGEESIRFNGLGNNFVVAVTVADPSIVHAGPLFVAETQGCSIKLTGLRVGTTTVTLRYRCLDVD